MKIILIAAITINGKIARKTSELVNWTSKEDKQFFMAKTKEAGVVIMGKTTYNTIGRPLPGRLNIVLTKDLSAVQNQPGVLEYTNKPLPELVAELESRGFKEAVLGGGASIYGQFLQAGLVDEIFLTIEPKIFGSGVDLFSLANIEVNLNLIEIKKLNNTAVLLHYRIM